jgi:hypothetical protein
MPTTINNSCAMQNWDKKQSHDELNGAARRKL